MTRQLLLACSLLAAAACGSGSDAPATTPPPSIGIVAVSPASASLVPGAAQQLTARATTVAGSDVASATFSWTTSSAAIATVTSNGTVTAVAPGSATITASAGTVSGNATIEVRAGGVVSSAGATVATTDGKVSLDFPSNAVPAQMQVSIEPATAAVPPSEHAVGGSAYTFGPSGTQFAQPVTLSLAFDPQALPPLTARSALRVAKLVGGSWQVVSEGAVVDSSNLRVRAQLRSFSTYGIVRDPCTPMVAGSWTTIAGEVNSTDCLFQVAGRRSDYYAFKVPANEMLVINSQGPLDGIFGIKASHSDPSQGTVWDSDNLGSGIRLVSNGSDLLLFVSGRDSTKAGSYRLTRTPGAVGHSCPYGGGIYTVLMPGTAIADQVTASNSCDVKVAYSPFPEAVGKPIHTHLYAVKLEAGKSYTITLSGIPSTVQRYVTLSVFLGNAVAGQDFANETVRSTRSVTVRPSTTAYYVIEPSSGGPGPGGYSDWQRPDFPYTLAVSAGR